MKIAKNMPTLGGRIFGEKKSPLKITILSGRIFGEGGGSAKRILPIYQKLNYSSYTDTKKLPGFSTSTSHGPPFRLWALIRW